MSDSVLLTLKNYWHNGISSSWTIYIVISFVISLGILSLLLNSIKSRKQVSVTEKLLSDVFYASVITLFLAMAIMVYSLKFTTFFGTHFSQLGFIIGIIITDFLTAGAFIKLILLTKAKQLNIYGVCIHRFELQNKLQTMKAHFFKMWLYSLILISPFAILLIPNTSKHLISIVLDNSGSMEQNLQYCTEALEVAILPTQKYADYVFTTIDYTKRNEIYEKAVKQAQNKNTSIYEFIQQYYDNITDQTIPSKLATNTQIFNKPEMLFNKFAEIEIAANGSPVYEGIWQNYIVSQQLADQADYDSKKMIIITDGVDNFYNGLRENTKYKLLNKDIFILPGKIGSSAKDFFGSISTINYGEYQGDMLFKDCQNSIDKTYDGYNKQSYFDAFRGILPEMYFDKFLLYILVINLIILSSTLLITKSSMI